MLKKMTLRLESNKNTETTQVLVGEDGETKLKIHLDTSKGFCPLRISLQKKTPPPGNIGGVTLDFKNIVETDGRFHPSALRDARLPQKALDFSLAAQPLTFPRLE